MTTLLPALLPRCQRYRRLVDIRHRYTVGRLEHAEQEVYLSRGEYPAEPHVAKLGIVEPDGQVRVTAHFLDDFVQRRLGELDQTALPREAPARLRRRDPG